MNVRLHLLATAALVSFSAGTLAADMDASEPAAPEAPAASGVDLIIELGVGGTISPEFEGSSDYSVSPSPIVGFGYLRIPGLFEIGSTGPDEGGLSIGPSFNMSGKRESDDFDAIRGLDDIDRTYEIGVRMGYEWDWAEVYGEASYAFGGAEGVVGEVGANAIYRPTPQIVLKAGPFATLASEDYMGTYFGVTPAESANTGFRLDTYDPKGGLKSVGVSGSARYEFRPDWFINADASWSRMVGDAADSPVVEAGDENQFTFGLGISKRFTFDLY